MSKGMSGMGSEKKIVVKAQYMVFFYPLPVFDVLYLKDLL